MTVSGTLPGGGARNGLPDQPGYVYRGKLPLEVELPFLCEGGCGRRLEIKPGPCMGRCAVCRQAMGPERGGH